MDPQHLFDHWEDHMNVETSADMEAAVRDTNGAYRERKQSGCLEVLRLVIKRSFIQQYRDLPSWVVDNALVFVAGLMLGS